MFYEPNEQEMYDGGFQLPTKAPKENKGTFKSTVDSDIYFDENHRAYVGPKEYPLWYGIENIGFIWINSWADPQLEYKGKQFSCYYVEDDMWAYFREEFPNGNEDEFGKYMIDHKEDVYELCEGMVNIL